MIEMLSSASWAAIRKNTRQLLLVIICCVLSSAFTFAQTPATGSDLKMQQYNAQALTLINSRQFYEAIPLLNKALAEKENSTSYYYLCHVHAVENDWAQAIKAGEKEIALSPDFLPIYPDLFYCYTKLGKWKDAEKITEQVKKASQNGSSDQMLNELNTSLDNDSFSKILLALFFILLGGAFFLPIYNAQEKGLNKLESTKFRFSEVLLISGAVSGLFWILFFVLSHWIWSLNPYTPYSELTPSIGMFSVEHDGIESFVMYILMFANIALTLFITAFLFRLRGNKGVYVPFFSALLLFCIYYFYSIGFIPPMMEIGDAGKARLPFIFCLLAILGIGGYMLYQKFSIVVKCIIVLLLAYTCLVMIVPSVLVDMSFMLYPAVRMMKGVKIPDMYLQYDLFLSLVALLWLKLNLSMESYPYVGQISYFLFFIATFFFTDRYFKSKGLSVIFILAYLIIRYYAIWEPGAGVIQVSPIRLDLWVIPMIVAYRKGVNHWLVGICMGMLILFHRNLGILYLVAYAELLVVLFASDVVLLIKDRSINMRSVSAIFIKHLRANMVNVGIIALAITLCFILFGQMVSPAAITYRKIGVGMIRISKISFYWYVPLVLSCLSVLLFNFRERLGERYSITGMFIVLIGIAESMYFFGRSHENGILTVSGPLILALFIVFDILIFQSPEPLVAPAPVSEKGKKPVPVKKALLTERKIYIAIPFVFLFFSGYYYSGRLSDKIDVQYNNFQEHQYVCPIIPMPMDTTAIRHITHNSPDVFFLDFDTDFYYYYYGHYTPLGYFNPCEAWIYRKELIKFMQNLIDKHYYVVYNARKYGPFNDYIPHLKYNQLNKENDMISVSKTDVDFLLTEDKSSAFHIAVKDTLSRNGMDYSDFELKNVATIEVVVKPTGLQSSNSCILNNFNRLNQLTGISLQASGSPNQYVFLYGSGQAMPSVVFSLEDNKWHYLTILINKSEVKVFDNGKLLGTSNAGAAPFISSDIPLTIGNSATRDAPFKGVIREVKISDGNKMEAEITALAQKLDAELNHVQ